MAQVLDYRLHRGRGRGRDRDRGQETSSSSTPPRCLQGRYRRASAHLLQLLHLHQRRRSTHRRYHPTPVPSTLSQHEFCVSQGVRGLRSALQDELHLHVRGPPVVHRSRPRPASHPSHEAQGFAGPARTHCTSTRQGQGQGLRRISWQRKGLRRISRQGKGKGLRRTPRISRQGPGERRISWISLLVVVFFLILPTRQRKRKGQGRIRGRTAPVPLRREEVPRQSSSLPGRDGRAEHHPQVCYHG
mmetsp:Transcript_32486/g.70355  ORF Transcript_32486/g.70355 Transcript_32486/m.70355 type:complete len:245 (-) Transcript_32486:503-1237(-)